MSKNIDLVRTGETKIADEKELLKQGILSNSIEIERSKQAIAKHRKC